MAIVWRWTGLATARHAGLYNPVKTPKTTHTSARIWALLIHTDRRCRRSNRGPASVSPASCASRRRLILGIRTCRLSAAPAAWRTRQHCLARASAVCGRQEGLGRCKLFFNADQSECLVPARDSKDVRDPCEGPRPPQRQRWHRDKPSTSTCLNLPFVILSNVSRSPEYFSMCSLRTKKMYSQSKSRFSTTD